VGRSNSVEQSTTGHRTTIIPTLQETSPINTLPTPSSDQILLLSLGELPVIPYRGLFSVFLPVLQVYAPIFAGTFV
jgi:hypothetical protein